MADRPGSAGSGGKRDSGEPQSMEDAISASLEKQKFRLLQQTAKDKKAKNELETRISEAEQRILENKQRLGEYNALFMSIEDAATKAPGQRLGAATAVMGTKRIIERELNKLYKEAAKTEMQLNKQKNRNGVYKGQVDQLRKEHITFKKLFIAMADELNAVKTRIGGTRKSIHDMYTQRDRAQEEMREIARQFEMDKLERQAEWGLFSEAIEKANKEGLPDSLEGGSGLLTQEQEEQLRKKIKKGQQKMAKDRAALASAQSKHTAFMEALQHVKSATGYDAVEDIVGLFNKYEDEKFQKVQAANRMVDEIELLEKVVVATRVEVQVNDKASTSLKIQRIEERAALEREVDDLEGQLTESRTSVDSMMAEVRALYPTVEFAFHATGCDSAFDLTALKSILGDGGRPSSPIRSKTASAKMYSGSTAMTAEVQSGVSAGSLAAFIGIIESHAADLIQQYAAMVSTGTLASQGAGDDGHQGELTRRFISPAALGPSRPPGRLKENMTSSALVAALAVDSSHATSIMKDSVVDEEDDSIRPMTMQELKKQAAAQISSDKTYKLLRSSASTAANVLTRVGVMQSL